MATAENAVVETVTVTLNGQEVQARRGQTILDVAREAGIDIPTLCHDPRLAPYGACRMCLVEVEGAKGPMASCGTAVSEGMKVQTHTQKIVKLRKFILELLLTNHPLDCPVCEAAGDCRLQDYAYEYLVDMVPWGWRPPSQGSIGDHPNVAHYGSRCILCGRCVRICREVMSIGVWGYLNRGYDTEVDTPYRMPMQDVGCVSCGQCVSTCPVGSVIGRRTPYGARQWQTERTRTTCSYCGNGCELLVHSYRGHVARVASETKRGLNGGNLCAKGRYGMGYVNSSDRLTQPLIRSAAGTLQPAGWREALDLIASKARQVATESGGSAFATLCGTHCTNEAAYLAQKLTRMQFASNNIDSSGSLESAATERALTAAFGKAVMTNSRKDLAQADVILVVGSNMTESNPVMALDVIKAVRTGKTVIVVDPRTTDLARKAKIHLAVKPGTDVALLRGVMTHILSLGLEDKQFIDARTEGYAAFKESLADTTVDAEAAICGVEPSLLRAAAEAYAGAGAAAILFGTGLTQQPGSVLAVSAIADLAMLTGNIGKAGTGVGPLLGRANSQGIRDMGVSPRFLPAGANVADPDSRARFTQAWGGSPGPAEVGKGLFDILDAAENGGVRFLYVVGDNPAMAVPDEQRVRSSLGKTEFLVVQDSFLSETAQLADVVLPSAVATEDDGTLTNVERFVQRVRQVVPPLGESRPDWTVIQAIANELGADWAYGSPRDVMREVGEVASCYAGVSYDRLDGEGLQLPCPGSEHQGTSILYENEFVRGMGAFARVDAVSGPAAADGDYPFVLTTGSELYHHDTGVRTMRSEGLTSLAPEPLLEINPMDATRLGITAGQLVRVSSRRAAIELSAKVTDRVPPGLLFAPGFSSAAPVTRLMERVVDPESGAAAMKSTAVSIERVA
ncbi:MAG TPA: molybdopterin-dependent oxidoreductase [Thermoleophilia bacterium]